MSLSFNLETYMIDFNLSISVLELYSIPMSNSSIFFNLKIQKNKEKKHPHSPHLSSFNKSGLTYLF